MTASAGTCQPRELRWRFVRVSKRMTNPAKLGEEIANAMLAQLEAVDGAGKVTSANTAAADSAQKTVATALVAL
jgi:hypothetical protein